MRDTYKRKSCEKESWDCSWNAPKKKDKRIWRKRVKAEMKRGLRKCSINKECEE